MSYRTKQSVGAMHPILFFVIVYGIALFLAFFICNTVYHNWQQPADMAVANTGATQFSVAHTAVVHTGR